MEDNYFKKYPELKEYVSAHEEIYQYCHFFAQYFEELNITLLIRNYYGRYYYIIDYNHSPIKIVNHNVNFTVCKNQKSLEDIQVYKNYKDYTSYKIAIKINPNGGTYDFTYDEIITLNYLKYLLQFSKYFSKCMFDCDIIQMFRILITYNKINLKKDNALNKISYKFLIKILNIKNLYPTKTLYILCLNQYYNIISQERLFQFIDTFNDSKNNRLSWFENLFFHRYYKEYKDVIKYCFKQQFLKANYDDYRDYVRMRNNLPKNIQKRFSTYPENVEEAHKKIILVYNQILKQKNEEENKLLQESYQEFYPKAKKFEFSNEDYSIIACKQVSDLITEGITLNHCVGSYRESVSKGKEYILFLRKNLELKTPYYTIDITPDKQIRQIHGKCNCNLTKKLIPFIKEWKEKFDLKGNFNSICCHL